MASSPFSWSQLAITQLDYDIEVRTPELKTLCEAVRGHPQERKLRQTIRLRELQLHVKTCIGDGSCLFRGLSFIIWGTDTLHGFVRRKAVEFVAENYDLFISTGHNEPQSYFAAMLYPIPGVQTNWPDEPEIVAACSVFGLDIRILSDAEEHWYTTRTHAVPITHGVLLYETHEGFEHYSVLVREDINTPPRSREETQHLRTSPKARSHKKKKLDSPRQSDGSTSEVLTDASTQPPNQSYRGRERIDRAHFLCLECHAITLQDENERCCCRGRNILSPETFPDIPLGFATILDQVPNFSKYARSFNNQCSFVTIGTKSALQDIDPSVKSSWVRPHGVPTMYALRGRTYHSVTNLGDRRNRFYLFMAPIDELYSKLCDETLLNCFNAIACYLREHNAFARAYRLVSEVQPKPNVLDTHFTRPPQNESEPFILSAHQNDPDVPPILTYMLYPKPGGTQTYTGMHACGEAGSYPLMFPTGHGGWHVETNSVARYSNGTQIRTIHQYVKYMVYQKGPILTRYGCLFQQWLLDQFSRWQSNVFHYMANDKRVRAGMQLRLHNMKDIDMTKKSSGGKTGRPFAVPASVPDSPAARRLVARQCLAIIAQLGNPHSWITFTCNRSWPEVRDYLLCVYRDEPGNENVRDLPDEELAHIAVRVYWVKFKCFKRLLKKGAFSYGRKVRWVQIVHEFQTRYWPHFHLLCQYHNYETLTTEERDCMYCARLFWYEECPLSSFINLQDPRQRRQLRKNQECNCKAHKLHRIVYRNLRHTCKSDWCRQSHLIRKDGTCDKRFPKLAGCPDSQRSFTDANGFFHPRRPYEEDAYVVCYNKLVLLYQAEDKTPYGFFNAHNNWDEAAGAHTVQYVHEYQHKGPDYTTLSVSAAIENPQLEFEQYEKCRHVGFCEALMRFLSMHLCENSPACTEIRIHLPSENFVVAPANSTQEAITEKIKDAESDLLRYFWRHHKLSHLTISEYYSQYTLHHRKTSRSGFTDFPPSSKIKPKTAFLRKSLHVASIHGGSELNVERHCLGLILQEFPRSSYDDCRTVNGLKYKTFAEAASALGIFSEHNEFELCLQELINPNAKLWKSLENHPLRRIPVVGKGYRIRKVYVTMIMNGGAAQKLFNLFAWYMTRDVVTTGKCSEGNYDTWLLEWIRDELNKNRLTLEDVGLHDPDPKDRREAKVRATELGRVSQPVITLWLDRIATLDQTQRAVFNAVVDAVLRPSTQRLFFINARAGCGKTFVCQCISAYLRSLKRIVLTSAPSALAASLHMAGITCHKCFGLPISNDRRRQTSHLSARSYQGIALAVSDLLIIDEISMLDNLCMDCISTFLQDIMDSPEAFGGKVILTAGEFAQLPPVVPRASREDVVKASIVSSQFWPKFMKFDLRQNWRHRHDTILQEFSDSLGSGIVEGQKKDGYFLSPPLPQAFTIFTSPRQAIQMYVGNLSFHNKPTSDAHFREIAASPLYTSIATAYHHKEASYIDSEIRQRVQSYLQTKSRVYISQHYTDVDSVCTQKWMASVDEMQTPEHRLHLFIGCKLRLMRNFDQALGLCNGTMLILTNFGDHYLEVMIITPGEFFGNVETLFKFKFDIKHSKTNLNFSRRQFPVRSAFAGTIHRFQGQGVSENGRLLLDASRYPFCHGHAYVAITRAQRCDQVIMILDYSAASTRRMMCLRYSQLDIPEKEFTDPTLLHTEMPQPEPAFGATDDDILSDVNEPLIGESPNDNGDPFDFVPLEYYE